MLKLKKIVVIEKKLLYLEKIVIIEKGCDEKIHNCNRINFSSNINEDIRAVLNSIFFLRKDFACTKSTKSIKSTRYKDNQAKAQSTNKQISDFFPLRCF